MIQMADVGIGISGQEGMQVQAETRVGFGYSLNATKHVIALFVLTNYVEF